MSFDKVMGLAEYIGKRGDAFKMLAQGGAQLLGAPAAPGQQPAPQAMPQGMPGMQQGSPGMQQGSPAMQQGSSAMQQGSSGMQQGSPGMQMGMPMGQGMPMQGMPMQGMPMGQPGMGMAPMPTNPGMPPMPTNPGAPMAPAAMPMGMPGMPQQAMPGMPMPQGMPGMPTNPAMPMGMQPMMGGIDQNEWALIRVMIAAAQADGRIGPEEQQAIMQYTQQSGANPMQMQQLGMEMQQRTTPAALMQSVDSVGLRKLMFHCAHTVLKSDLRFDPMEMQFLKELGIASELSQEVLSRLAQ